MKKIFTFKSITAKMLVGFLSVILLVILLGIYNISITISNTQDGEKIINQNLPLLTANKSLVDNLAKQIASARGYLLFGADYKDQFYSYTEIAKEHEEAIRKMGYSDDNLHKRTSEWQESIINNVFAEYDKGNKDLAIKNLEKISQTAKELMASYEAYATDSEKAIYDAEQNVLSNEKNTMYIQIGVTTLVILLSIIAAIVTSSTISRPVKMVAARMKSVANGDLSQEPLELKTRDEIGQLIEATNEMTNKNRDLLIRINEVSDSVSRQSEELTQSATEVKTASLQVASTMEDLTSGSEELAGNASEMASVMGSFTGKVEEVNNKATEIYDSSNQVLQVSANGSQLMEASAQQMHHIEQIMQQSVEKVNTLDHQSKDISNLVLVIQEIADQTNLLALNAAIEAARAGEQGKGFAVVATEVKKLAEQVSHSIKDITSIVDRIQKESSLVAESLTEGYAEVEKGSEQIQATVQTFTEIFNAVMAMTNHISDITTNISSVSENTLMINHSIDEIASFSEQSAAGIEQTSASTQQTTSSMEMVVANSKQLSQLAEKLDGLVKTYKL